MSSLDLPMTLFGGPGWLSDLEERLAALFYFFPTLPQIETDLLQIQNALPQIQNAQIQNASVSHPSVHLSTHLSVTLSVRLFFCLSVCLSV